MIAENEPIEAEIVQKEPKTAQSDVTVDVTVAQGGGETAAVAPVAELPKSAMRVGDIRFGITCTGEPIGQTHWLADSAVCGDMVMALPSSVLIAGRTKEAGGVAVDVAMFLDSIMEGAAKLEGLAGVAECSSLPVWAVSRLFGTFPVLLDVYHEAIDQAALAVEAAAMKASIGLHVKNTRKFKKTKRTPKMSIGENGKVVESVEETVAEGEESLDKYIPPDPTLSKMILTSRMKGRYKDEGGMRQAIQINISPAAANL